MYGGDDGEGGQGGSGFWLRRRNIITSLVVFAGAMAFVAGAFHLAQGERQFALRQWEKRLQVGVADPASKVAAWLDAGNRALREVAANATVQIYLSELEAAGFDKAAVPQGEAQAAFVGSYILSAGARGPFAPRGTDASAGHAMPLAKAGLALFDGRRHFIASSPGYKPSPDLLARLIGMARRGRTGPLAIMSGDTPVIVFFTPILPLQHSGAAAPIGYAVGARMLDGALLDALRTPLRADGGRVALLAREGYGVRYLAATDDKDAPSPTQELALSGQSGVLAAVREPGRLHRALDSSGQKALLFGDRVAGSPLVLVASVPEASALAGVEQRQHALLGALLLAILAIIAVGVAFSRHHAGLAATQVANVAKRHAATLVRSEGLLKSVVNAYPGALLLVHSDGAVGLVNARFAGEMGTDAAAFTGQTIETILPASWRSPVGALLRRREAATAVRTEFHDSQHRWHAASVVPLAEGVAQHGAAIVLIDDITDQVEARERRSRVYRGIVDILLEAIDRRDPAAAAHSRRVGALSPRGCTDPWLPRTPMSRPPIWRAACRARASSLFPGRCCARQAASAMPNGCKSMRRRSAGLGFWGRSRSISRLQRSRKLAHDVAHGGRPASEGGASLQIAYVVAAANAYVALTSPRAYRTAHPRPEALDALAETLPSLPGEILDALRHATEFAGRSLAPARLGLPQCSSSKFP